MRAKHFILTKNNYSDKDIDRLKWLGERIEKENINYLGYVKDIAPKTGTPHLHIYVEFSKYKTSNKTIKRQFFECDTRAITSQAHKHNAQGYIKNKKDEATEYGKITEQGQRTDILNIWTEVPKMKADGMTMYEIWQEIQPNSQQLIIIKNAFSEAPPYQLGILPKNIWIWGESGVGKTTEVYRNFGKENCHKATATTKWIGQGYQNQRVLLLDDVKPDTIKEKIGTELFLDLTDRWHGTKMEYKGGFVEENSEYRIVISKKKPEAIMNAETFGDNLITDINRRFHIINMKKEGEKLDLKKYVSKFSDEWQEWRKKYERERIDKTIDEINENYIKNL